MISPHFLQVSVASASRSALSSQSVALGAILAGEASLELAVQPRHAAAVSQGVAKLGRTLTRHDDVQAIDAQPLDDLGLFDLATRISRGVAPSPSKISRARSVSTA
jgi:hypothetical protein